MKVIWEPCDLLPGRRYSKPGIQEVWMIGYLAPGGADRVVSVSLSDGRVTPAMVGSALAADLTEQGYLPIELVK